MKGEGAGGEEGEAASPLLHTVALERTIGTLLWSPDGTTLIAQHGPEPGTGHDVSLWRVGPGERLVRVSSFASGLKRPYNLALSPDGARLATVGQAWPGRGALGVWRLPGGEPEAEYAFPDDYLLSAAFTPDGERLLAAGNEEVLHVVHLRTGAREAGPAQDEEDERFWGLGERNTSVVCHPDGRTVLVTACFQAGSMLAFCELDPVGFSPRPDWTRRLPADVLMPAAFRPDGRFFAFADWEVRVYDWPDRECRLLFDAAGDVRAAPPTRRRGENVEAFWSNALWTPDGATLLCGSPDGSIFLWDVPSGTRRGTLAGHAGGALWLALDPTGTRLVSSGRDKTLRLWRLPASGARLPQTPPLPQTLPLPQTPSAPAQPGCAACRAGAYGASWPPPQRVAVNGDGPTYLHWCERCGTFWQFDMRFANPVPEARARTLYPAHFADWSPPAGLPRPPLAVPAEDFTPLDPLALRDAPPEGELEHALAAAARAAKGAASPLSPLRPLLRASRLYVASSTAPAPDGAGMSPLALHRPPMVWVLAWTRPELARRFARDAPWCLGFEADDLIARLPPSFGLCLNFGALSECLVGPG